MPAAPGAQRAKSAVAASVSDMQCVAQGPQCRFWTVSPRVGWAWMVPAMSSGGHPFPGLGKGGGQFRDRHPYGLPTEDQVVVTAGDHPHEATFRFQGHGPAVGGEGELRDDAIQALLAGLLGRLADHHHFRVGEAHRRDGARLEAP